eukprot:snap_masked-scaffold_5-processed-gene-4.33-mRNA-1 protein AED:1.00 eAED:1.00 QI:0/-1/0/0/-1/1/1/0/359
MKNTPRSNQMSQKVKQEVPIATMHRSVSSPSLSQPVPLRMNKFHPNAAPPVFQQNLQKRPVFSGLKRSAEGMSYDSFNSQNLKMMSRLTIHDSPVMAPLTESYNFSLPNLAHEGGKAPKIRKTSIDAFASMDDFANLPAKEDKKHKRLEKNRNAARFRRHKKRLTIDILELEKAKLETSIQFLKKLKISTPINDGRNIFLGVNVEQQLSKPFVEMFLKSSYMPLGRQVPITNTRELKKFLLYFTIGNVTETTNWCHKLKHSSVKTFLKMLTVYCNKYELGINQNIASSQNKNKKGLYLEKIKVLALKKICKALQKKDSSVSEFPGLEAGLNSFRSVFDDKQVFSFYSLIPKVSLSLEHM